MLKKLSCLLKQILLRKTILYPLSFILILSGCTFPFSKQPNAALQVTSNPKATVFLNDKEVGKTPYYEERLIPGEYNLKLISQISINNTWQTRVKLIPGVLTVVSRDLGPSEALSSGNIISLEKLPNTSETEISVISTPSGASVSLDQELIGITPISKKGLKQGEHTVTISLSDFRERNIKVQGIAGYRLLLNIQLAQALAEAESIESATSSAALITPSVSLTPTPSTAVGKGKLPDRPRIKVLETPTGWLNVRSGPSMSASILTKINPAEYYPYLEEQSGWVKIKYEKEKEGWVSVQYVEKQW